MLKSRKETLIISNTKSAQTSAKKVRKLHTDTGREREREGERERGRIRAFLVVWLVVVVVVVWGLGKMVVSLWEKTSGLAKFGNWQVLANTPI